MTASQASPRERFPVPPYPKDGVQQGEVFNLNELQPLKLQSSDDGAAVPAPGDAIPVGGTGWKSINQDLRVDSGYLQFPRAMGDSNGTASVILKNYSTTDIRVATDTCWFDLFEGNRICLRISFTHNRSQRFVSINQVVDNHWTDQAHYNFPPDLVAGREITLKFYLVKGAFTVAFNDNLGVVLTWGAPADSMEYRADHAGDAIFRDWVPAQYGWNASPLDILGDGPH